MAQIANLTGNTADATNYSQTAQDYITQWYDLANAAGANPPHTTLSYGDDASYSEQRESLLGIALTILDLLYNLFADAELNLGLVKQEIYTQQANFYSTVLNEYGVPLDTRHAYTKGDWEMFAAAIAGSSDAKGQLISALAKWINQTPTNLPYSDLYDTESGKLVH